jgi:HEAT repeat protein
MANTTEGRGDVSGRLRALFDAERQVRGLHAELCDADTKALHAAIRSAIEETEQLDDEDEVALRLVRMAAVLGELEGPVTVDLLIDILASDEPEARHAAGEALEELAFDRFKEVALGVERALERLPSGSVALVELPYILAQVAEPGVMKLLQRFLAHKDAETVAAGVEALVELGDPAGAALLAGLEDDRREVPMEDEDGEEGRVTLGELVREARDLLGQAASGASVGPSAQGGAGGQGGGPRGGKGR